MVDINNFQRVGSISNARVGADFEIVARDFFMTQGISLLQNHQILVGAGNLKKYRRFDLGSNDPAVLVECKSHAWTSGGNVPSAKLTVWNEAMYYFHISPPQYRKILFALKSVRGVESLAEYYVRCYAHMIPPGVEIWEHDAITNSNLSLEW
jgi:hypothetical protein